MLPALVQKRVIRTTGIVQNQFAVTTTGMALVDPVNI